MMQGDNVAVNTGEQIGTAVLGNAINESIFPFTCVEYTMENPFRCFMLPTSCSSTEDNPRVTKLLQQHIET